MLTDFQNSFNSALSSRHLMKWSRIHWCNQDFFKIKTKTLISRPRPRLCISRPRPFLWCITVYYRPIEKHFSFSAVNENADENEIPFTAENETKTKKDIHFRPINENESHLIKVFFFLFHTFSHQVCPAMRRQYIPRPVSPFCSWSLSMGFHFPHVQCCGIFLDDISTRERFAFLVYCYTE